MSYQIVVDIIRRIVIEEVLQLLVYSFTCSAVFAAVVLYLTCVLAAALIISFALTETILVFVFIEPQSCKTFRSNASSVHCERRERSACWNVYGYEMKAALSQTEYIWKFFLLRFNEIDMPYWRMFSTWSFVYVQFRAVIKMYDSVRRAAYSLTIGADCRWLNHDTSGDDVSRRRHFDHNCAAKVAASRKKQLALKRRSAGIHGGTTVAGNHVISNHLKLPCVAAGTFKRISLFFFVHIFSSISSSRNMRRRETYGTSISLNITKGRLIIFSEPFLRHPLQCDLLRSISRFKRERQRVEQENGFSSLTLTTNENNARKKAYSQRDQSCGGRSHCSAWTEGTKCGAR